MPLAGARFSREPHMEKSEAIERLRGLLGQDLVALAKRYGVTVRKGCKLNKGWAGHVIERYLGFPLNSAQLPNGGRWELKVVPLRRLRDGRIVPKETMAITMINPRDVLARPFEKSHLLMKLREIVVCARMFESKEEVCSRLVSVGTFDLDDPQVYDRVRADYEEVRETIRTRGFDALTGRMGVLVQPRTKGPGHGSRSRAFYARKEFVARILKLPGNE